jgi:ribokinase
VSHAARAHGERGPERSGGRARPRVIVVGSANTDLVLRVPRLPHPGETTPGATLSRRQGGKGANQAAATARLGAATWMVGRVGDDERGGEALGALEESGVDCSWLGRSAEPTGLAVVLVDDRGENMIAVAPGANGDVAADWVREAVSTLARPGAVVLACLEIPVEAVRAASLTAREKACRFVLNPAPALRLDADLIALCDVLTPNERELPVLATGGPGQLLRLGAGAVVVTLGEAGASLHRPDRAPFRQPAFRVAGVDATGAGDAFSGTLAWALASGRDLEEAVGLAAAAGALATRGLGARASLATSSEVWGLYSGQVR